MYLKRLVLNGFKSFADRTEFEFGRCRTSIVGPNGCGKSNVLDAIRWVLGEQSARTLRGGKMLDVVFSGSRSRKGAAFAEVELTFDNSSHFLSIDTEEVSVSRLLYSSGESEYRLNGASCRLKDVRDLFLDTGIGVDAYSVIEQGRVDALLQASPQERREIFEEAAGISRYKVRRAEAARKLERTQQNLLRLNDLLDELERRLRSVKLAAGKARNFQEYDARLRELRATASLAEYHELEQARGIFRRRCDALSDLLHAKRALLARRDATAAELAGVLQELDEQIRAHEAQLAATQAEATRLAERVAQLDRRCTELGVQRQEHETRAAQLQQQCAALSTQLDYARGAVGALIAARAHADACVAGLQEQQRRNEAEASAARAALAAAQQAAAEALREQMRLESEQAALLAEQARLTTEKQAVIERCDQVQHQSLELDARRRRLDLAGRQLLLEFDSARARWTEVEARVAEVQKATQDVAQQVGALREQRSATQSRLAVLEDMERRREGLAAGARWLMELDAAVLERAGVVGLLADVIRVDHERVAALQVVLSRIEHIVIVEDAVRFATVLGEVGPPPGALEIASLSAAPHNADSGPAPADTLQRVDCEPRFRPLVQSLLGGVVLVETFAAAVQRAAQLPTTGAVFAAPDGSIASPDGRAAFAGRSGATQLIGRRSEIRRLEAERDELESRLGWLSRKRSELDSLADELQLQRSALGGELAAVQKRQSDERTELLRIEDEAQRVQREFERLRREAEDIDRRLAEGAARGDQLSVTAKQQEQTREEVVARCAVLQGDCHSLEARLREISEQFTAARVEAGRAAERCRAAEATISSLTAQAQRAAADEAQSRAAMQSAEQRLAATQAERQQSAADREQVCATVAAQEQRVAQLRAVRSSQRRQIEHQGAIVRELASEVEQTDDVLRERQMAQRECEIRREALMARAADELQLSLEALYASYTPAQQDPAALSVEMDDLRGKIARLGHVNLDAITELQELEPRCTDLAMQRTDLVESVARLETLITELDQESKSRFAASFEEIRVHFQELFRKVFGGGKADIVLEDPERPLECGIDIIARPPGKEPQSISLLSGGEKTLAAIALLLAVFRSKPSPFAILDEVDAALDEANVERFNRVLSEFEQQSQFIVITHSKKTMQFADVLYGVTMEEPGVSKRVSVRLDERVEAPVLA